ncbi:MAG TPA: hypothetical protein VEM76_01170 [Anaeromyxobacteraceae bacterium]|nr:hypothetical protein [Anaeromyxobacteraceae bacterium]
MRPVLLGGVPPLPGSARGRARAFPKAGWLVGALAIVALLVALGLAPSSERRALRALPDEQRLVLLSRTVDDLRKLCSDGRPDAIAGHCRELASFAAQFDECAGECEALARHQLAPVPTR